MLPGPIKYKKERKNFRDLTHLDFFSIDNVDSFDLDQLTYAEELNDKTVIHGPSHTTHHVALSNTLKFCLADTVLLLLLG